MSAFLQSQQSIEDTTNYEVLRKRMQEAILQTILDNTTKTRDAVDALQDSLARIETITEQNQKEIENLNEIVWKPVGDNLTLVQAYAEQSVRIRELAGTVGKIDTDLKLTIREVESDLRGDIASLSSKLDSKNQVINSVLLGLLTAIVGAAIGLGGNWFSARGGR